MTAILGIDTELPKDLAQPLAFAMIVKGLDGDGKLSYWTVPSDGLTGVEIIGMMRWGEFVAMNGDSE